MMTDLEKWLHEVKERLDKSTPCGLNKQLTLLRIPHDSTDLMKAVRIIESLVTYIDGHVELKPVFTKEAHKIAAMTDEEIWK